MVIQIDHLEVSYKGKIVVNELSLESSAGECFGLLGPNGAGKTTTIECIEGIRKYHKGSISVLGLDPRSKRKELSKRIGIQLQESCYQDKVKVIELCKMIASFYPHPANYYELLEEFHLYEHKNKYIAHLSGGLKQRLSIVLAMIPSPEIVFFDELTTGLDPEARITIWEYIKKLKKRGINIFLTTHYLEEAEKLCDRIGIMNNGELIKVGNPEQIIQESKIEKCIVFNVEGLDPEVKTYLEQFKYVIEEPYMTVYPSEQLNEVASYLLNCNISFSLNKPSLEAAYLAMIGQEASE